jgi:hypothetical protein
MDVLAPARPAATSPGRRRRLTLSRSSSRRRATLLTPPV